MVKRFPVEEFAWIDDIFPEEEEDDDQKEEQAESNPTNWVFIENIADIDNSNVLEVRKETEDVPPL